MPISRKYFSAFPAIKKSVLKEEIYEYLFRNPDLAFTLMEVRFALFGENILDMLVGLFKPQPELEINHSLLNALTELVSEKKIESSNINGNTYYLLKEVEEIAL